MRKLILFILIIFFSAIQGKAQSTYNFSNINISGIVTAGADGVHPGTVSLVGNTTLPSLPANTVSIIGPPSATPTSWSLQLATAIPTTAHLLGCTVTGTNCLLTDEGAVPTGTVTSIATTSPITGGTITATGTIACATCVTSGASLTSTNIMTGAGSQASQTPSSAATLDSSGNMAATSIKVGTSPPTCAIGTAGVLCENEGTAPTGAASVDMVYADSTGHCLDAINNNTNDGCLLSVTNGATFPLTIVSGVSGAVPCFTSTTQESSGAILNTNILVKGGGAGACPTNTSITDDAKNITSAEVAVLGNKVFVTSDFTDSTSTTLQIITGLSWTLPTSKAVNVSFHCALIYDQTSAAVSDSFGIGITGTAPSQANAAGTVQITAGPPSTFTAGNLTALASTTPTAVVTFTPGVAATLYRAELDGTIEQPSNATPGVFSIYASTTTGTDNFIVKRGSYCSLF